MAITKLGREQLDFGETILRDTTKGRRDPRFTSVLQGKTPLRRFVNRAMVMDGRSLIPAMMTTSDIASGNASIGGAIAGNVVGGVGASLGYGAGDHLLHKLKTSNFSKELLRKTPATSLAGKVLRSTGLRWAGQALPIASSMLGWGLAYEPIKQLGNKYFPIWKRELKN